MSLRPLLLVGLAPLLAGCGVPDLVAHTVKAMEHSDSRPAGSSSGTANAPAASAAPAAAQASPAPAVDPDPPPVAATPRAAPAPAGRSGAITSEELPPPR